MSGSAPRREAKTLEFGFIFRALLLSSWLFTLLAGSWPGAAQDGPGAGGGVAPPSPPPRVLPDGVSLGQGLFGRRLDLAVRLDRAAPFRVFTLDAPRRLVIDLRGVDATALLSGAIVPPAAVSAIRLGRAGPGWSRLTFDLARPLVLDTAGFEAEAGGATLRVVARRVSAARFAERSGAPPGADPEAMAGRTRPPPPLIVIDPGHGGVDPGAGRDGVAEKDITLAFARELSRALAETGRFRVALTRDDDAFLPLADRVTLARSRGATAFISVHANAVEDPAARGGIVFTLSEGGSSGAARDRAAAENRADTAAGLPPANISDPVADALDGLRRAEAQARSIELAHALSDALRPVTDGGTQAPLQSANFQVLRIPDVPAALLELGFLSNDADRGRLTAPLWQAMAADAIADGLADWIANGGPLTRLP